MHVNMVYVCCSTHPAFAATTLAQKAALEVAAGSLGATEAALYSWVGSGRCSVEPRMKATSSGLR